MKHIICNSYKKELFEGIHNLSHQYRIALFDDSFIPDENFTSYNHLKNEIIGIKYNKGGFELKNPVVIVKDNKATLIFDNIILENYSITARGALIYNASLPQKNAISIIDFEENLNLEFGTFIINFYDKEKNKGLITIL